MFARRVAISCSLIVLSLGASACERSRLLRETRQAAEDICACVTPDKSTDDLSTCYADTWKRFEAKEIQLHDAHGDDGPEYAAIHARRLECQDNITRRQLELVDKAEKARAK
jgi:hypothetical protein